MCPLGLTFKDSSLVVLAEICRLVLVWLRRMVVVYFECTLKFVFFRCSSPTVLGVFANKGSGVLWGRPERWHETGSGRFPEVSEGRCRWFRTVLEGRVSGRRQVPEGFGWFRSLPKGSGFRQSGCLWKVPEGCGWIRTVSGLVACGSGIGRFWKVDEHAVQEKATWMLQETEQCNAASLLGIPPELIALAFLFIAPQAR